MSPVSLQRKNDSPSLVENLPFPLAVLQQELEFIRSQRLAKQKALHHVTGGRSQIAELLDRFNAFGHHSNMQIKRQFDDGRHDGDIFLIMGQIVDQGGIKLEYIDRKIF